MDRGRAGVPGNRQAKTSIAWKDWDRTRNQRQFAVRKSSRRITDKRRTHKCWTRHARRNSGTTGATLNYMRLNETDVQHAGKDVCAKMANPTQGKLEKAEESRQVRVGSVRR